MFRSHGIILTVRKFRRLAVQSSVWTERKYWTVLCVRNIHTFITASQIIFFSWFTFSSLVCRCDLEFVLLRLIKIFDVNFQFTSFFIIPRSRSFGVGLITVTDFIDYVRVAAGVFRAFPLKGEARFIKISWRRLVDDWATWRAWDKRDTRLEELK